MLALGIFYAGPGAYLAARTFGDEVKHTDHVGATRAGVTGRPILGPVTRTGGAVFVDIDGVSIAARATFDGEHVAALGGDYVAFAFGLDGFGIRYLGHFRGLSLGAIEYLTVYSVT